VGKAERQQEYGNPGDFRDDLGYLKLGDSIAPDVIGQADLGELGVFGLDCFKEAAAAFGSLLFDPLLQGGHAGFPLNYAMTGVIMVVDAVLMDCPVVLSVPCFSQCEHRLTPCEFSVKKNVKKKTQIIQVVPWFWLVIFKRKMISQ